MKYIDLHTDALTKEGVLSVTKETLTAGGCFLECFACFTPHGGLSETLKLCNKFEKMCISSGYRWVKKAEDLEGEGIHAMLTVEGGEAIEGDLKNLDILYEKGVRMMTLVWNFDNELGGTHGERAATDAPSAHPERSEGSHRPADFVLGDPSVATLPQDERKSNPFAPSAHPERSEGSHRSTDFVLGDPSVVTLPQDERASTDFVLGDPSVATLPQNERGTRGLTPFGRETVEKMGELHMLVDVSHGSDELFSDVAAWSKARGIPFVASHSDARAVLAHTRNLSDGQIKLLADCGGVMGLNFYDGFLSSDKSAAGQKTALIAHISHILKVGGEDVLAIGSDFDGIPQNAYMKTAADMPRFIGDMCEVFPPRIVEKIAYANAERVIREGLGN